MRLRLQSCEAADTAHDPRRFFLSMVQIKKRNNLLTSVVWLCALRTILGEFTRDWEREKEIEVNDGICLPLMKVLSGLVSDQQPFHSLGLNISVLQDVFM